ncbi:MAG: YibE/F family protein [Candidatus Paceibacteria bacterium]
MKKLTLTILSFLLILSPAVVHAQGQNGSKKIKKADKNKKDTITRIEAEITEVEEDFILAEDEEKNRYTIDKDTQYTLAGEIHKGDNVILREIKTADGSKKYIIDSFSRANQLILLFVLFVVVLLLVNGKRGLKSIINLGVTYLVILLAIIPFILSGWSPILVAVVGGIIAMGWNIYFTHGFTKKSHATIIGIASSLLIVGLLGWFFIRFASLSGSIEQGANILSAVGYEHINFRGLLLAAVLIGALGVLDDLVISQVSVVQELKETKPDISKKELFTSAMRVGHDHTSAIVNTLVLAYTSAAFPLVILFSIGSPPFNTIISTLNNETVATEIMRMLVGGIGILLSMPIATLISVYFLAEQE